MLQYTALKKIQFQAAATEIENQARLQSVTERPFHGGANQPSFLLIADDFQFQPGFPSNAIHQFAIVSGLAGGGCGYGSIGADLITIHAIAKLFKSASCSRNGVVIQHPARKRVMSQANCGTLAV